MHSGCYLPAFCGGAILFCWCLLNLHELYYYENVSGIRYNLLAGASHSPMWGRDCTNQDVCRGLGGVSQDEWVPRAHLARGAQRRSPDGLWGPTRPWIPNQALGKHLNYHYSPCFTVNLQHLRCVSPQNTTETGPRPRPRPHSQPAPTGDDVTVISGRLQAGHQLYRLRICRKDQSEGPQTL